MIIKILRLIIGSLVFGWLINHLLKTVWAGIKTGEIHHTDTKKICNKKKNPIGFWALVTLFSAFICALSFAWIKLIISII